MDPTFTENATDENYTISTLGDEFILCDLFSQVAEEVVIDGQSTDEQFAESLILEEVAIENNEEPTETMCDDTNYSPRLSPIDELNETNCPAEEEIIVDEQTEEAVIVQVQYVNGNFYETEKNVNQTFPQHLWKVAEKSLPLEEIIETGQQEKQHVASEKKTASGFQRSFEKHIKLFYPKDGKAFKCRQCNLQFPTLTALSNHCKTIHNFITKRHGCEYCLKYFIWQCDLKRHLKLCPQNSKAKQQRLQQQQQQPQQETTKTNSNKKHLQKPYICNYCNKSFSYRSQLKLHLKKHTGEPTRQQFNCIYCAKSFSYSSQLEIHLRKHTGQPHKKEFVCNYCNKSFGYNSHLKLHMGMHTGKYPKKQFNCNLCTKSFGYKSHLEIHLRRHNGDGPKHKFNCNYCSKTFAYNSHLLLHIRKHTGEGPKNQFSCNVCNKTFGYRSHLEKHLRIHTDERPYACASCDKSFRTKNSLIEHQSDHTDVKSLACFLCEKPFKKQTNLKAHQKICNGKYNQYKCDTCNAGFSNYKLLIRHKKTHNPAKYICEHCSKSFYKLYQLQFHLGVHTGERPFMCSICYVAYKDVRSLRQHKKGHITEEEKKYLCEICSKPFSTMSGLRTHRQKHSDERPYSCCWCGNAFKWEKYLLKHKRAMHPEQETNKPAENTCEICSKSFKYGFQLKFHLGVHTGERPFMCSVCNIAYKDINILRKHEKIHLNDKEKTYLCEICSKPFLTLSSLQTHYQTHTEVQPFSCCWCGNTFKCKRYLLKHKHRMHPERFSNAADQNSNNCHKQLNDCNKDFINSLKEPKEDELNECINNLLNESNENDLIKDSKDCNTDQLPKSNNDDDDDVKALVRDLKEEQSIYDLIKASSGNELLNESNDCIADMLKDLNDECKKDLIVKSHSENKVLIQNSNRKSKNDLKPKTYDCEKCSKTFHKSQNLRIHLRVHSVERPYICSVCKKTFKDKRTFAKHEKFHLKVYSADHRYQCSLCERAYKDKARWQEHERRHVEPEYRRDRPVKNHVCEICSMKFGELIHYQRHVRLHSVIRPHQCNLCEKGFFKKANLRKHLSNSHKIEEVKTFKNHEDVQHICEYCNKVFVSISELNIHLFVHTRVRSHVCGLCNKTFLLKHHLTRHLKNRHPEKQLNSSNKEQQPVLPSTKFICVFCNKCFTCNSQLRRHLMIHTDERPFSCQLCGNSYRHKSHLNRHLKRNHKKDEVNTLKRKLERIKYCCKFCEKSFEKVFLLDYHQKLHLKQKAKKILPMKNISCKICFKSFKRLNKLTNHLRRMHQTQRNCVNKLKNMKKCDVCKKTFRSHLYLDIHMRHVHPNCEIKKDPINDILRTNNEETEQPKTNEDHDKNDVTNLSEILDTTLDVGCKDNPPDLTPIIEVIDMAPNNDTHIDLSITNAENDMDPLMVESKEDQSLNINNNKTKTNSIEDCEFLNDSDYIEDNNNEVIKEVNLGKKDDLHTATIKPQTKKNAEGKKYICDICSMKFKKFLPYKRHLKLHSVERPYPCALCDKAYIQKAHLNRHIRNNHSKSAHLQHICTQCNKSFNSVSQLKRHSTIHNKKRLFSCSQCKKRYKHEYLLKYHHKSKHLAKQLTGNEEKLLRKNKICKICTKSFDRLYKLTIHLRKIHQTERNRVKIPNTNIETNTKLLTTKKDCEYITDNSEALSNLENNQDHCPDEANENQSLSTDEIETNSQLLTTVQDAEYNADKSEDLIILENKNDFSSDIAANDTNLLIVDTNENQSLLTHDIETSTAIEDSEYMADNADDLIILETTNDLSQRFNSNSEHCFRCSICEIIFKDKRCLSNHQRIHVKSPTKNIRGDKKYICEICFMKFSKFIKYKKHLKLHSADRPFPCVLCDKAYLQNSHLSRHLISCHSKEEVNALKKGSSTESQNSLNSTGHRKCQSIKHIKKRNYSCNLCKKSYKHEYLLKYHRKKHLKQKIINKKSKILKKKKICKMCGKTFDRLHKLNTHYWRLHKTHTLIDSEDNADEVKLENNENNKVEFSAHSDCILDHLADTTIIDITKTDEADEDIIGTPTVAEENDANDIANHITNIQDNHNEEYISDNYKIKDQTITLAEILKESAPVDENERFHTEIEIKDEPFDDNTSSNDFSVKLLPLEGHSKESLTQQEPKLIIQEVFHSTKKIDKEKSIARCETDNNTDTFLYSCSACKKSFKTEFLLKFHEKKHSQQETTGSSRHLVRQKRVCRYCFKFFDGIDNLNNHINRIHLRKAVDVKILPLSASFDASEKLTPKSLNQNDPSNNELQMNISNDKQTVKDNSNHSSVNVSQTIPNQEEGINVCKLCSRSFASPYNLNRHLKMHTRDGAYSCSMCQIYYKDKRDLVRHQKKHVENFEENLIELTPISPAKDLDPLVEKSIENNSSMDNAATENVKTENDIADKTTVSENTEKSNLNDSPKQKKDYICTICSKNFSRGYGLRRHLKSHPLKNTYVCVLCGKAFKDESTFSEHQSWCLSLPQHSTSKCLENLKNINIIKNAEKEGKYTCIVCSMVFAKNKYLKEHLRRGHNKKNHYVCYLCKEVFKYRSDLENHQQFHITKYVSSLERELKLKETKAAIVCKENQTHSTTPNNFENYQDNVKHLNISEILDDIPSYAAEEFIYSENIANTDAEINTISYIIENFAIEISKKENATRFTDNFTGSALTNEHNNVLNPARYQCSNCKEVFDSEQDLIAQKFPSQMCEKVCKLCSKTFERKEILERHLKQYTGEYSNDGKTSYNCHHQRDQDRKTLPLDLKCGVCDKTFTFQRDFLKHVQQYHRNGKAFKCLNCNERFSTIQTLYKHRKLHGCELCLQSIDKDHSYCHKLLKERKTFTCEFCGKTWKYLSALKHHLITHAAERPFTCQLCDKSFKTETSLKEHANKIHFKKERKPNYKFSCKFCSKKWSSFYELKCHLISHSNERPFSCSSCPSTYKYRYDLKKHEEVHLRVQSGELPYYCAICIKGFKDEPSWIAHQELHTVKCSLCERAFKHYKALRRHQRSHLKHQTGVRCCTVCKTYYKGDRNWFIHQKMHLEQKTNDLEKDTVQTVSLKLDETKDELSCDVEYIEDFDIEEGHNNDQISINDKVDEINNIKSSHNYKTYFINNTSLEDNSNEVQ